MLADYTGIVVILVVGTILVGAMLGVHLLLGPRRSFPEKQEPFECGEKQIVRLSRGSLLFPRILAPRALNTSPFTAPAEP